MARRKRKERKGLLPLHIHFIIRNRISLDGVTRLHTIPLDMIRQSPIITYFTRVVVDVKR